MKIKFLKPTTNEIYLGVLASLLFSLFLYLEYFGVTIKLLNTITGLLSLALFLYIPKRAVLLAGFLIGLFWFYWVGFSFKYYGFPYLVPVVSIMFGLGHMLLFGIVALTNKTYFRAILLYLVSYVEPMGWNWIQIGSIFVDSYIGVEDYQLIIVLISLSLTAYIKKPYKYLPLLLITLAFNYNPKIQKEAELKIKLVQTDIKQDKKWLRASLPPTVTMTFKEIRNAINNGYDIIVFPESVFPLYMNKNPKLIKELLKYSQEITIIAGSLISEDGLHYNVTYMFNQGNYEIAKKIILVPFGEYIPLPKFARRYINEIFFGGASDFKTASKPTDFTIKGVKFRNAICYEATCPQLYEGDVDFIISTSNNAWFTPSIQPTIQKILMRYYGRKYGVTNYHSANAKGTGIIK